MEIVTTHPAWEAERVARLIAGEPDVLRVVHIRPIGDRWQYLIETPFGTFPRFVIGSVKVITNLGPTDPRCIDVRVQFKCGRLATAEEEWNKT